MSAERPRRLGTVRVRTTAAAMLIVGAALAVGAVALVSVQRATLTESVRDTAWARAGEVATSLESGGSVDLAVAGSDEQLIQVLEPDGDVVASSDNVAGEPAVAALKDGAFAEVDTPLEEGLFLVVAESADTSDGPRTVIVGLALEDVFESTDALVGPLAVGIPLLVLFVGATTWTVTGRTLAPVESIRREVDGISASELHRRVPQPTGSDEVSRLALTMNRMLDRLEAAQAGQRRFVSDASHELRTPIAAIRQAAEVALAHPSRYDVPGLAGPVLDDALRVQRLTEDLLLLARADEHALTLRRVPVDVDDLVFAGAVRLGGSTRLRVDTRAVSAARVQGDSAGLRRVIGNLADNAARHAASTVAFRLSAAEGLATLIVDDDGPGIPPADRGRVFERFVRLDHARAESDGGSGLGLAIVAEIVAAHGGEVAVGTSDLGGARLRITLPGTP